MLPRKSWSFRYPDAGQGLAVSLEGGFKKGRIYELVYASADPVVVGISDWPQARARRRSLCPLSTMV